MSPWIAWVFGSRYSVPCLQSVFVILIPAFTWLRMNVFQPYRQPGENGVDNFFGQRVETSFIESSAAQSILRAYRVQSWSWTIAGAALYVAAVWLVPLTAFFWAGPVLFLTSMSPTLAFWIANRRTCAVAPPPPGSESAVVRTAPLFVDDANRWLTLLDWICISLPVAAPIAAAILLASNLNLLTDKWAAFEALPAAAGSGAIAALSYFALRFRARSSDWSPDPLASRKYRAALGTMMSSQFTFLSISISLLVLMNLNKTVPWLHRLDMKSYFAFSFPAQFLVIACIFGIRHWLKRHAPRAGNTMPEEFWKSDGNYCNPNDPALVVPARVGIGCVPNRGRRSIGVGTAVFLAMILGSVLLMIARSLTRL
jgi:hypothetical protein